MYIYTHTHHSFNDMINPLVNYWYRIMFFNVRIIVHIHVYELFILMS